MLKSLPVSLRAAAFALLAVVFHACTPQRDEVPTPDASPALTIRDAQNWYQSTYPTGRVTQRAAIKYDIGGSKGFRLCCSRAGVGTRPYSRAGESAAGASSNGG